MPATLTGVLKARLDGLPADERLTLQRASVIGAVFWDRALNALDETAPRSLPALRRRDMVLPRTPGGEPGGHEASDAVHEVAFKHHLLHQVTYDTVLKRSRRELHARLADWLAAQTGLRAHDFVAVIAGHYERAGDAAQAAEFHARAAEQAQSRFAHGAVLDHVERALASLDTVPLHSAPALRWRLLCARERTLDVQGHRDAQQRDIQGMEQLATESGDAGQCAQAAYRRCVLSLRQSDWPACERAGRLGMVSAAQAGHHELRLLATRMVAIALAKQGRMAQGQALVQDALLEVRARALPSMQSLCLNALALFASLQTDMVAMLNFARQGLLIDRDIGNRRGEASSLSNVGCGMMELGQLAQARRDPEEALQVSRANGDRVIEGATLCNLSTVALRQGDATAAWQRATEAVDRAAAAQSHDRQAISLCKLGHAELALGHLAAAASAFEHALQAAAAIGEPVQYDARAGLAQVALAQGRPTEALAHVAALVDADSTLDSAEEPRRIELTCYQVLAANGRGAAAQQWLQRAATHLQQTAEGISDPAWRHSLLNAIPAHRDIVAALAGGAHPRPPV